MACKLLAREFGLGDADAFVFNMSVGYDLQGIKSEKIDAFIEGMKDASGTGVFGRCLACWRCAWMFSRTWTKAYVASSPPCLQDRDHLHPARLSPGEIERIACYLMDRKG